MMGARAALAAVLCAAGLLAGAGSALAETVNFKYTGKEQQFKVPAGVRSVHVVTVGGAGGSGVGVSSSGGAGGLGAVVSANFGVKAGQTLYVEVGGKGGSPAEETGAFNGGGRSEAGGGGGGASDVRTVSRTEAKTLESRLLVAAGGGGGGLGFCVGGGGGAGGNAEEGGHAGFGCAAFGDGGGAGTSTTGGAGGAGRGGFGSGEEGVLGAGGGGIEAEGGGGGGGLYGGGSGGEGFANGGGGGGSNLVPKGGEAKVAQAGEEPSVTITPVVAHETATSIKCSPASLLLGQSTICTATVKDEAATGATAPTGMVAVKTSGEGSLEGMCTLTSQSISSSSCSVTYTPSETTKQPERTDTITVTYEGDETHEGSKGTATVTVTTPAVIPGVIPPVITPPPPPVAPVLSGLIALHRCVTSAVLEHAHAGSSGLAFSFTLSEAANVTFAVLHRVGSPAWRRCPPVRGRTPSTYRSVGKVGALVSAGQQTISLGSAARARRWATVVRLAPGRHRISLAQIAQKRLPPGTYVVSAKAVNSAGQASSVDYAKFWVFS
jgi:hypothetical protein